MIERHFSLLAFLSALCSLLTVFWEQTLTAFRLFLFCAIELLMFRKDRENEYYTDLAHKEGYPARSVYKLKEMDERFHLFKKGDMVLDLGSSPGSWLLYLSRKVGDSGRVVGVDLNPLKITRPRNTLLLEKDVTKLTEDDLQSFLRKFHAVVSDLAPATSGIDVADMGRSLELAEQALAIAQAVLAPKGTFICKVFQSPEAQELFFSLKQMFRETKMFRPKAVMKRSREVYIVAKGFKPIKK